MRAKNRFLITGVCGFVAKYFIEYLISNNIDAEILGLDIVDEKMSERNENEIFNSRANEAKPRSGYECSFKYKNFKYKKADLLNKPALKEILEAFKPAYVVHLASISSVSKSWEAPVESFQNNTNIFLNLIESLRELKFTTRVLSVGSSEEYGNYPADKMPLREEYELHPDNPYSVARVSQEMLSKLYAKSFGVNIIITRSFNHIGPGQKDIFVISSFIKQLVKISENPANNVLKVGNIEVVRDFLDVRDVVDAYYKILMSEKVGEVYNICSGKGIKLKDIITTASRLLNIAPKIEIDQSKIRPTDSTIIIGDNSKLKNDFNWQTKYSLENTLNDMIAYYKENN